MTCGFWRPPALVCLPIGGIGTPTTAAQSSTSPQRPQEARTPPPTTCRSTVPATAALDGRGRGCPGVRRCVCVGVCVGVEAPLLRTQGSKCPPGPQSLRRHTAPITNPLERSPGAIAIAAVWRVETGRAGIPVGMGGSLHHTKQRWCITQTRFTAHQKQSHATQKTTHRTTR